MSASSPASVSFTDDSVGPDLLFSKRIPSLDGLRAIAIFNVLVGHVSNKDNPSYNAIMGRPGLEWLRELLAWSTNGDVGVRLFFTLSGFLITWLLLVEEHRKGAISLRLFYLRRALRILPVYYTFLLAAALICAVSPIKLASPVNFLQAATFTTGWWPDMHVLIGHTWSLSVEETFYLLWPISLCTFRGASRWRIAWSVIAIAPLMRLALYHADQMRLLKYSALGTADAIMWGCLAAMVLWQSPSGVRRLAESHSRLGRLTACAIIFISNAAGWAFHHPALIAVQSALLALTVPLTVTIQAMAFAYLICSLSLHRRGMLYWLLNTRSLIALGILSYSLYLWQEIFLMHEVPYQASWWQRFPQNLPLAVGAAVASYFVVERPILRLKDRFKAAGYPGSTASAGNMAENVLP